MRNAALRIGRRLRSLIPSKTLDGYENPELVGVVFRKTLAYEPTGPAFDLAGARTVLDFGGGCGLHYKEARSASVRWAVVETPAMVARASELSTDRLRFFSSAQAAAEWLGGVDMVYSDGALQYTADPGKSLAELCAIGAGALLWRRVELSETDIKTETQTSWLADNGPGKPPEIEDKRVAYRMTKIPERDFLAAHAGYRLADRGPRSFRFVKEPG